MQTSHNDCTVYVRKMIVVCLQETWLDKNDLFLLSNTNNSFMGNVISSTDDKDKINVGRAFGGVGIMWRKQLNTCCTFRTYHCDRIVGLEIKVCKQYSLISVIYLFYLYV